MEHLIKIILYLSGLLVGLLFSVIMGLVGVFYFLLTTSVGWLLGRGARIIYALKNL